MFPGRTVGSAQKVAISGEGQPSDDCCEIPFAPASAPEVVLYRPIS